MFVPHLGQSVTISRGIEMGEGATKESVVASLGHLWVDATSYARSQDTRPYAMGKVDWSRYRFDERLAIDRADEVSLFRLTESWGWTFRPKGPGGSSDGEWLIWTTIDDREVHLSEGFNDGPDPTSFVVSSSFILPQSTDPETWAARWEKSQPEFVFFASKDRRAGVRMSIDLSKGVTLGDLRHRIQAFADLTRRWERG